MIVLGAGSALALGAADAVFVAREVIPPIYLADAAAEGAFLLWWAAARGRSE